MVFTPRRMVGTEILDAKDVDPAVRERSIADVTRSNLLFGGRRAMLAELRSTFADVRGPLTLLDVGTGLADIPRATRELARKMGIVLFTVGLDEAHSLLARAHDGLSSAVCGNALALPFHDASIDVVTCSQLLHHFHGDDLRRLVRELSRVARRAVVIADLRRSWLAAGGFWLASWPLRFHPVTRHDGVVSVLRGFTPRELAQIVQGAMGTTPRVHRRLGFRVTAQWTPPTHPAT